MTGPARTRVHKADVDVLPVRIAMARTTPTAAAHQERSSRSPAPTHRLAPLPAIGYDRSQIQLGACHKRAPMADDHQVRILAQGGPAWNRWRRANPKAIPDLRDVSFRTSSPNMLGIDLAGANLRKANLEGADFYRAWLVGADFRGARLGNAIFGEATLGGAKFAGAQACEANFMKAHLPEADFTGATLIGAKFYGAFLEKAKLRGCSLAGQWFERANLKDAFLTKADLSGADLRGANLHGTDLRKAILRNADLRGAQLIETDVTGADFSGARVHGVSVWGIKGAAKSQERLVISSDDEATITVDDLDVAQFIYLLRRREKLRNVIDAITSKAVLILGRFTPERKAILDAVAEELRAHRLLPIIFDFKGSTARDLTETIKILAGMSLFVIADVTNPKSSPLELEATVPDYEVPFVIIIQKGKTPFPMLASLKKYPWVIKPILTYPSAEMLRKAFKKAILDRAWAKRLELQAGKMEKMKVQSVEDFLR
jgi:uncharacterized protein YjbI with pentapeptide repeats